MNDLIEKLRAELNLDHLASELANDPSDETALHLAKVPAEAHGVEA